MNVKDRIDHIRKYGLDDVDPPPAWDKMHVGARDVGKRQAAARTLWYIAFVVLVLAIIWLAA